MNEQQFDSIWDAIEDTPVDAGNMKARAAIMAAIREVVEEWDGPRAEAAARLNIT